MAYDRRPLAFFSGCVAIIQPSKLKIRTMNYILAPSHHDRMRGAMWFCPGVTFCSSKQSLKLYESPIDKQHKYEQNLKRNMRQSFVDVGLSTARPSDLFSCDHASSSKNTYFLPFVCLSVRLSHLFDNVPVIVSSWNFQELLPLTDTISIQKVKVRGQRSGSQRSWPHLAVSRP